MFRLIYKSRAVKSVSKEFLDGIQTASRENNLNHLVGGFLFSTDTHFLQVLEGRFDDVNYIFQKIMHDPRHEHIELISFREIDARLYDHWEMKILEIGDVEKADLKILTKRYGEDNGHLSFPVQEWEVLALHEELRTIKKSFFG